MSEIDTVLAAVVELVKTIAPTNQPEARVWRHPGESSAITMENLPAVVISKMSAEAGTWVADSFGAGLHQWELLIAVYVADGPIVITNSDDITINALEKANEWYKLMADLLYANMTLNGTVNIIGDGEGKLFDYVTDNILWDGRQFYGHLFIVPVEQRIIQGVSS